MRKASQHDIGFVKPKRLTNAERLDRDQSWLQRERDALNLARMRFDDQHKCFIPLNQGSPLPGFLRSLTAPFLTQFMDSRLLHFSLNLYEPSVPKGLIGRRDCCDEVGFGKKWIQQLGI